MQFDPNRLTSDYHIQLYAARPVVVYIGDMAELIVKAHETKEFSTSMAHPSVFNVHYQGAMAVGCRARSFAPGEPQPYWLFFFEKDRDKALLFKLTYGG